MTRNVTSKCKFVGLLMNWLSCCTYYDKSGRLLVKYTSCLTSCMYGVGSNRNSPESYHNLLLRCIGDERDFVSSKPVIYKSSKAYLR